MKKKMRSLDALLEEAKWGHITEEELDYVADKIKQTKPGNDDNLYTMIFILGRGQAIKYRKLIESFLYYPSNPMISKIALQSLCHYWGDELMYKDEIKKFVRHVEWTQGNCVRIIAVSAAGSLLRETIDTELLQLLLDIFDSKSENFVMRSCAYQALSLAMTSKKSYEIPDITDLLEENPDRNLYQDEIDMSGIEKARQILAK